MVIEGAFQIVGLPEVEVMDELWPVRTERSIADGS
jgi:hypothetical protein